jgi:transposase-like protein
MTDDLPKSLLEAVRYFSDLDVCHAYMRRIKWPSGKIVCPKCDGSNIGTIETRRMLKCRECKKQFSCKVGTIFEDSPLGLDKWFVAVWCIANDKNGISSHELGRALGVTQKTAWFMLHRIRKAMEVGGIDKFDGPAEADTSYIGGAARNMHWRKKQEKITGRGAVDKTAVHGVLQRGKDGQPSQVSAVVIGDETAEVLMRDVRRKVRYAASVYTDQAHAYGDLALTHIHRAVDHSRQYVLGEVHTNGLENFWSLLKRGLNGTYVAVAPFHLFRYVVEQVFRFNVRKGTDASRFHVTMLNTPGKRLTYKVLTGQNDAGFMGLT